MNSKELLCISLLRDCKTLNNLKQIHAFASKTGLLNDPFIAGKLLLLSSVCISNALDYACRLFLQVPSPDIFMYNTLIRGFSESGSPQQAIVTYIQMRHRSSLLMPDNFSFAFVLKAAANYKSLNAGIQLHSQSLTHGFDAHLFVKTTLVSMYAECGCFGSARKAFDEMHQPNVVAWNAVVTSCFRCGDVSGAEKLFGEMPFRNLTSWNLMLAGYMKAGKMEPAKTMFRDMCAKDSVSWSTMIVGFAHNGSFDEAFCFFREMRVFGMRPNEVSLTGVLSACAQAGALEFGKILHGYIEKSGSGLIISVSNALLDTYSRCGNVGMAHLVFDHMMTKNTVSWTSMIAGFAMHGFGEEAIRLFHEMEESGMAPDSITFISILYACSHAGLIEQGSHFFNEMQETYMIEPSEEHYGCMVDLYGRAGLLNQAYEFIIQMPIEPNEIIWRTLLGACSIHGDVELAEQVKEQLSQLDPNNSGDHVLLSNIYAVAGKWKDAAAVRRSMTDLSIKKAPGWSMIEVDKIMYGFVVGEAINGVTEEAYNKLAEIMSRIRVEGGYIPEIASVLHDIEEEEKENAVTMHSEKLAVAFGMSRLSQGVAIRVVKNLRVCRDCHTVMKLISKVYGQEITLRDRNRFHLFQEGHCSCRDYW